MKRTSLIVIACMAAFAAKAADPSDEKQLLNLEDDWVKALT
jgi:hypothetical protein